MRSKISSLLLLFLIGCASAPKVRDVELDYKTTEDWTAAESPPGSISDVWWQDFGEPELTRVVELALTQNYDLLAAATRVDQAATSPATGYSLV